MGKGQQRIKKFKAERDSSKSSAPLARRKRRGYSTVPRTRGPYGYGEMKYFDTTRTATAVNASTNWAGTSSPPNSGTPNTLVAPVVGSAIDQRIGRMIKLYKLSVRGMIYVAPQTNQIFSDNASQIRILLVQDMQTNGTQADGDIIMTPPATADTRQVVLAHQNIGSLGRFRVWKDKTVVLQNPNGMYDGTNVEQQGLVKPFKFKLSFKKGIEVRFNAVNGGTIADIVDNSFNIYASTSSADLAPTMVYRARAYYKE